MVAHLCLEDDYENNGYSRATVYNGIAYLQINNCIMALDFKTGDTIWENRDAKGAYCTPIVRDNTVYVSNLETSFLSGFQSLTEHCFLKHRRVNTVLADMNLSLLGIKFLSIIGR